MKEKHFSMYEILDKKKNGKKLEKEEIKWVVDSLMNKTITDYQMSAFLMASFIKGLSPEETAYLTDAMLYSGKVLKFTDKKIVDKHSTGGIGDKTSFILAPIAAACGVKVPMIAGRGLGHTGGTVDKIEAIKGFKTSQDLKQFEELLFKNNLVLIGQTEEIAPADKQIYALRDVTATIDSIPLITASIMSKKLAEGANGIVMDIKVGSGAFMKTKPQAKKLAKSILDTAKRFNKKGVALITNMDEPLGLAIGNSSEIIESIETLKGNGPKDLTHLSLALSAHMIVLAGIEKDYDKAYKKAEKTISDGSALDVFKKLIKSQGGDSRVVDDTSLLPLAKEIYVIKASKKAYIKSYKADLLGLFLTELGGGRKLKTDKIDFGVSLELHAKIGDLVEKGSPLLTIRYNKGQEAILKIIEERFFKEAVKFSASKVSKLKTIYEVVKMENKKAK